MNRQEGGALLCIRCLVSGVWCLVSGVWCLVSGVWCLVSGVWCFPLPCLLSPVSCSLSPVPCLLSPVPCSRFPVPASRFPIPDYRKKDSIVLAIGQFLFLALRCDLSAFTPIRLLVFNFFSKRDSERFDVLLNSEKGIGNFASI